MDSAQGRRALGAQDLDLRLRKDSTDLLTPNMPSCYDLRKKDSTKSGIYRHWILPTIAKRRYYMKNTPRLLCSWSLDAATKRNSLASMLSKAVPVAIGLWCLCSRPAFAAEVPVVGSPFDPQAQLTREQGKEYWDRYVTGDWWGLRTLLHNRGVDFNLDYFSETATNFSGGRDNFSGYPKCGDGDKTGGSLASGSNRHLLTIY